MKKSLAVVLLFCLACLSCVSYHSGMRDGEHFPGIASVTIMNLTKEGTLSTKMKQSIYEQIRTRPGLRRKANEDGVNLTITLQSQDTKNIARAETRDRLSHDEDEEAYQTVLSRVFLDVKFVVSDNEGTDLLSGTARGQGDLPWMNDQNIAYQDACTQAVLDAARQVAEAITDADWTKDAK